MTGVVLLWVSESNTIPIPTPPTQQNLWCGPYPWTILAVRVMEQQGCGWQGQQGHGWWQQGWHGQGCGPGWESERQEQSEWEQMSADIITTVCSPTALHRIPTKSNVVGEGCAKPAMLESGHQMNPSAAYPLSFSQDHLSSVPRFSLYYRTQKMLKKHTKKVVNYII